MSDFLIYGAYGYTGTLIAREAAAHGQRPVLAGRNAAALAELAGRWDWSTALRPRRSGGR